MKASQLHRLAACSDLARLDGPDAALTIEAARGELQASYRGTYCAGMTVVDGWEGEDFCTTIVGSQFRVISGLFSADDEVFIKRSGSTLQLKTAGQVAALRVEHGGESWNLSVPEESIFGFQCDRDALIQEFEYASLFTGKKGVMSVLTGIRLGVTERGVSFSASDSVTAIYAARLSDVLVDGSEGSLILAGEDILTGLKLMNPGPVMLRLYAERERLVVTDEVNIFYTVGLGGEWPDFAKVLGKPEEGQRLQLSSSAIQAVSNAASALNSGPDIELIGKGTELIVRTTTNPDMGAFALRQEGEFNGSRVYDGATLTLLTKLADTFEFNIPNNDRRPTRVTAGTRTVFLISKYLQGEH